MHKHFVVDIIGIVLAGGRSKRFGTNKAFAELNGKKLIQHVLDVIKICFNEIVIVTNTPNEYEHLGYRVLKDIEPYQGPLGGIVTALKHFDNIFVCACDMPFVTVGGIKAVAANNNDCHPRESGDPANLRDSSIRGNDTNVVAKTCKGIEPLFALYNKSALPYFENSLKDGSASVVKALCGLRNISYVDIDKKIVSSINTEEDMNAAI